MQSWLGFEKQSRRWAGREKEIGSALLTEHRWHPRRRATPGFGS